MGTVFIRASFIAMLAGVVLCAAPSRAQPPALDEIPLALRPWVPWVLADQATYGCTPVESAAPSDLARDPICVWPASLRLEILATGANFAIEATADRGYALTLPGSGRVWPIDVRVDAHAAPVVAQGDGLRDGLLKAPPVVVSQQRLQIASTPKFSSMLIGPLQRLK